MSSLRMPGSSMRTMTDWAVSQHSPARRAHVGKALFDSSFPPCFAARTYWVSAPLLRVSTSRQPSVRLSHAREIPRSSSDRSFLMGSIVSSHYRLGTPRCPKFAFLEDVPETFKGMTGIRSCRSEGHVPAVG